MVMIPFWNKVKGSEHIHIRKNPGRASDMPVSNVFEILSFFSQITLSRFVIIDCSNSILFIMELKKPINVTLVTWKSNENKLSIENRNVWRKKELYENVNQCKSVVQNTLQDDHTCKSHHLSSPQDMLGPLNLQFRKGSQAWEV